MSSSSTAVVNDQRTAVERIVRKMVRDDRGGGAEREAERGAAYRR